MHAYSFSALPTFSATSVVPAALLAALLAAAIIANHNPAVATALDKYRENQTSKVLADPDPST